MSRHWDFERSPWEVVICRNYDEPGKIGTVGGKLGKAGVNIRFMSVAPIDEGLKENNDGSQSQRMSIPNFSPRAS